MYIDSHCHLDGEKFDADRAEALERAAEAGIEALLAIGNGTGPGAYDCGIRVAEKFPGDEFQNGVPRIYTSVGIHPHDAKIADESAFRQMEQLAKHPAVIAWGEIGLDYWYDFSPRDIQKAVFVRQMELAQAAGKPIIIHCRGSKPDGEDAWNDTLELIRIHGSGGGPGGILHCFTGQPRHLQAALDMGFMISIAGNVTFPKAQDIQDAARRTPADRLLIETDSPYLAPVPHRGRRNEPAFVREVANFVGGLRQLSGEEVGSLTAQNFYRFFHLH